MTGPQKIELLGILQEDGTDFLHAVLVLGWKDVFPLWGVSVPPLMTDSEQLRIDLNVFLYRMRNEPLSNEPLSKQFQHNFLCDIQAKLLLMMFLSFGLL